MTVAAALLGPDRPAWAATAIYDAINGTPSGGVFYGPGNASTRVWADQIILGDTVGGPAATVTDIALQLQLNGTVGSPPH